MTIKNSKYKGIILAGGSGTRLHPITKGVSKHMLPVYDKPMIYYPLSVFMLAGITDILLISSPEDIESYKRLLGNGSQFGISLKYEIQDSPGGIAQAFIIGKDFISNSNVALILGDNIFYGQHFSNNLYNAMSSEKGATIFGYYVHDAERFGVVEFDKNFKVISIEEKPSKPKSNYAVTGLYFYDNDVINIAESLKPSKRGELEITDINKAYLDTQNLNIEILGRGFTWLDTGTHDSLMEAGQFIKTIESQQGLKIACLEEIAFKNGWINKEELKILAEKLGKTNYGNFLIDLIKN